MLTKYLSADDAFVHELYNVLQGDTITVRGMKTKELTSKIITVLHPEQRCYFVPQRNDNIFAKVAETLWMMAGRDDISWLAYYLPRAIDYSDNGRTWRGAYGPRLRNWNGANYKVDQVKYALDQLNLDPFTRQAVITIWDPSEDTISVTKDRPCNNWIQFYARDTYGNGRMQLHMNITQRSCDILWGYSGIDTFSWSVLHQMMAYWTDLEIGMSNHFITSLHLYEKHWSRAQRIAEAAHSRFLVPSLMEMVLPYERIPLRQPVFNTPFKDLSPILTDIFLLELQARETSVVEYDYDDEFIMQCAQMFIIYSALQRGDLEGVVVTIDAMHHTDFRAAAIEYATRDHPELLDQIELTETEKNLLSLAYGRV